VCTNSSRAKRLYAKSPKTGVYIYNEEEKEEDAVEMILRKL